MARLLKILAIGLGVYLAWANLAGDRGGAITDAAAADVEIYTTRSCGECKRAKAYMNAHDIAFVERDVEGDIDIRREFYARGGKGVPWIFVYGTPLEGFDEARFERLRARGRASGGE